jgi:3-hydroxy-9,10-secoandrosta-1,3,5(10)-triene-9,17-dione monooxygenase reductase component
MSGPDTAAFRAAIGSFPTGVAVVTAISGAHPAGLTTNAFSSLSLDPLLLLVCVDRGSRTLPVIRQAGRFAVNLLRDDQEDLAKVFASKRLPVEKFDAVTHTVEHGVPVLDGALAWFACELEAEHDGGDHVIAVGRVTALEHDAAAAPLRYEHGRFG